MRKSLLVLTALVLNTGLYAAEKLSPGQAQLRVQVWRDRNVDGVRESNDPPIYGATVNVFRDDGTQVASKTQTQSGQFVFNDLPPGNYYFEVQPPPKHIWYPTLESQGGDRLHDSDLNKGSLRSDSFPLSSGQVETTMDAGLARLKEFTGYDDDRNRKDNKAGNTTAENRKEARRREREANARDKKEHDELMKENATGVDGLFQAAERKFKAGEFGAAYGDYQSVLKSDNPKSEKLRDKARARVLEMEKLAGDWFTKAQDQRLKSDLHKELEALEIIYREFFFTRVFQEAQRRLVSLKLQPDVQALLMFWDGERAEKQKDWVKALSTYHRIVENERYKNSLGFIKASKRLHDLESEADIKKELELQRQEAAAKEAPGMLSTVKNLIANNEFKAAEEKLRQVAEKFPGTTFAADAENELAVGVGKGKG